MIHLDRPAPSTDDLILKSATNQPWPIAHDDNSDLPPKHIANDVQPPFPSFPEPVTPLDNLDPQPALDHSSSPTSPDDRHDDDDDDDDNSSLSPAPASDDDPSPDVDSASSTVQKAVTNGNVTDHPAQDPPVDSEQQPQLSDMNHASRHSTPLTDLSPAGTHIELEKETSSNSNTNSISKPDEPVARASTPSQNSPQENAKASSSTARPPAKSQPIPSSNSLPVDPGPSNQQKRASPNPLSSVASSSNSEPPKPSAVSNPSAPRVASNQLALNGSSSGQSSKQPSSSSDSKVALLLECNAELIRICVEFQARELAATNQREFQEFTNRLQMNLAWLAASADRTKSENTAIPLLPIMVAPPSILSVDTTRLKSLYDKLPHVFAKEILRRQKAAGVANLKRQRLSEDHDAEANARKRQDIGNEKVPSVSPAPPASLPGQPGGMNGVVHPSYQNPAAPSFINPQMMNSTNLNLGVGSAGLARGPSVPGSIDSNQALAAERSKNFSMRQPMAPQPSQQQSSQQPQGPSQPMVGPSISQSHPGHHQPTPTSFSNPTPPMAGGDVASQQQQHQTASISQYSSKMAQAAAGFAQAGMNERAAQAAPQMPSQTALKQYLMQRDPNFLNYPQQRQLQLMQMLQQQALGRQQQQQQMQMQMAQQGHVSGNHQHGQPTMPRAENSSPGGMTSGPVQRSSPTQVGPGPQTPQNRPGMSLSPDHHQDEPFGYNSPGFSGPGSGVGQQQQQAQQQAQQQQLIAQSNAHAAAVAAQNQQNAASMNMRPGSSGHMSMGQMNQMGANLQHQRQLMLLQAQLRGGNANQGNFVLPQQQQAAQQAQQQQVQTPTSAHSPTGSFSGGSGMGVDQLPGHAGSRPMTAAGISGMGRNTRSPSESVSTPRVSKRPPLPGGMDPYQQAQAQAQLSAQQLQQHQQNMHHQQQQAGGQLSQFPQYQAQQLAQQQHQQQQQQRGRTPQPQTTAQLMNQGGWAAPGNMNMGMNPTAFQMNAGSSSQPMLQYINPSTMALPSHAGSPQGASSHAWQQQQNAAAQQQQQQYGSGGTGAGSPAGSIHHSERAATPRHASATPVPSAVLGEPEFDATSMYTWG